MAISGHKGRVPIGLDRETGQDVVVGGGPPASLPGSALVPSKQEEDHKDTASNCLVQKYSISDSDLEKTTSRCWFPQVWRRWGQKFGGGGCGGAMSEKYMSIGAPMTELPVAQPRGYTSHSHRSLDQRK